MTAWGIRETTSGEECSAARSTIAAGTLGGGRERRVAVGGDPVGMRMAREVTDAPTHPLPHVVVDPEAREDSATSAERQPFPAQGPEVDRARRTESPLGA